MGYEDFDYGKRIFKEDDFSYQLILKDYFI